MGVYFQLQKPRCHLCGQHVCLWFRNELIGIFYFYSHRDVNQVTVNNAIVSSSPTKSIKTTSWPFNCDDRNQLRPTSWPSKYNDKLFTANIATLFSSFLPLELSLLILTLSHSTQSLLDSVCVVLFCFFHGVGGMIIANFILADHVCGVSLTFQSLRQKGEVRWDKLWRRWSDWFVLKINSAQKSILYI